MPATWLDPRVQLHQGPLSCTPRGNELTRQTLGIIKGELGRVALVATEDDAAATSAAIPDISVVSIKVPTGGA